MREDKNDRLFKEIAEAYVDTDGQRLKESLHDIETSNTVKASAKLDRRVLAKVRRINMRGYIFAAGTAACVFLLIFAMRQYGTQYSEAPVSDSAYNTPPQDSSTKYELLDYSPELPSGYSVSEIYQDKAQTIYQIANTNLDDVILTLERSDSNIPVDGLKEIDIKGVTVYGVSRTDYKLLRFKIDDVLFTLSCRYDSSTLFEIVRSIL